MKNENKGVYNCQNKLCLNVSTILMYSNILRNYEHKVKQLITYYFFYFVLLWTNQDLILESIFVCMHILNSNKAIIFNKYCCYLHRYLILKDLSKIWAVKMVVCDNFKIGKHKFIHSWSNEDRTMKVAPLTFFFQELSVDILHDTVRYLKIRFFSLTVEGYFIFNYCLQGLTTRDMFACWGYT